MSVASLPPHLPEPFPDPQAYRRAYEFIRLVDDAYHGDPDGWREARIPPGLPAEAVYRRLPTAPDFEYAGYLTKTRIRYAVGWDSGAHAIGCKPCCFHTHPTEHPHADLPSFKDLYSFVRYSQTRHVIAAGSLILVLDKTTETLAAVERLNAWEARCQIDALTRFGFDHYAEVALKGIGFRLPQGLRRYRRVWPTRVEEKLGVQVTVLKRRAD